MRRVAILALIVAASVGASIAVRSGSAAPAAPAAAPGWATVKPIFAAKCAGCHYSGGIAPFSLTSAASAKAHAREIMLTTAAGWMPPWPPSGDSAPLYGSERRILTADEKSAIAAWVRGGAQIGRGGSLVPVRPASTAVGTTLTLAPAKPYTPRASGGGLDDYHCFLLEPKAAQDMFVTSASIVPQAANMVHHVILYEAEGENAAIARQRNAASGGTGWTCFGGPGLADTRPSAGAIASERLGAPNWIAAWVPGHSATDTPKGTGVLLHKGAAIVMQVHYNLIHTIEPDRSRAVLKLTPAAGAGLAPLDTILVPAPVELPCPSGVTGAQCSREYAVDKELREYGQQASLIPIGLLYLCRKTLADYPLDVGAGTSISTSCNRPVSRSIRIYGVAGHMHLRGSDIRVELNGRTLLHIPRWDFHWQDAYYLREPVDAGPGDTIRVTCSFDNSVAGQPVVKGKPLAPRYVIWGEGSTDEMCLGLLQVTSR